MNVLVCGASGCVGSAVASALRSRGHRVIVGGRAQGDSRLTMHVDFMQPRAPSAWAPLLSERRVDVIVNCVGILIPSRAQNFERVHSAGPIEMFRGAALAGVSRVIQISALGVGADPQSLATPYLHSKLLADDALAGLGIDWAVLRPSLIYGPGSASAELFATLASLPVISLPGGGEQQVQPVHVYELAEAVARLVEQPGALRCVHEIGGAAALSYREMLATYRGALGLGAALWLRLPMALMRLGASVAEWLPQKVFSRDTLRLLERGSVPTVNAAAALLGREPTRLARGLQTTPPTLMFDLRVELPPAVSTTLRAALALMWICTALVSALFQSESGVMHLLARCGLTGAAGQVALLASCTLNLGLGLSLWLRPSSWTYALQTGAVLGYTLTAALHMPELVIDHCGPLVKNLPVFGLVLLLWLAHGAQGSTSVAARRTVRAPDRPKSGAKSTVFSASVPPRTRLG